MIDRANLKRIERRIKKLAADGKLRTAQAGEAGTAETTKIGSVHEHAVPEGNAP